MSDISSPELNQTSAKETAHTAQPSVPAQTFGQKAVGLSFNPTGNDTVTHLKKLHAEVIDAVHALRARMDDPEVKRMCSVAITELQTAQMWAVKAATWVSAEVRDAVQSGDSASQPPTGS